MGVNGILLLDKDEGWTSQDCVSKLRGILGERRIGHAGTLDPLATGLLVVLVGRATRAAAFAEAETKEYVAAFRPGIITDTQDITGNLLRSSDVLPSEEDVRAALPRFTGEIEQIPPMYSAIKINGRKLYDIARRGGEVEREARRITIHSIDYLGQENGDHMLRIRCSKGTYIRTLCHDLGEYLGCGGCMAALRRTRSGSFSVENARAHRRTHARRPRYASPGGHALFRGGVSDAHRRAGKALPLRKSVPGPTCRTERRAFIPKTASFSPLGASRTARPLR